MSSSAAPSPRNCSWREAPHRQQREPRELEQAARAERGRQARARPAPAGSATSSHRATDRATARKPASNSRHASPSPAAYVVERRRGLVDVVDSAAHRPSAVGCASTSGECRHRRPWDREVEARMTGDATPSG